MTTKTDYEYGDKVITFFGSDDNVEMKVLVGDGKDFLCEHSDPSAIRVWRNVSEMRPVKQEAPQTALEILTTEFGNDVFTTKQAVNVGVMVSELIGLRDDDKLNREPIGYFGVEWRVRKQDSITAVRKFFASL